jgi:hypothetical protein
MQSTSSNELGFYFDSTTTGIDADTPMSGDGLMTASNDMYSRLLDNGGDSSDLSQDAGMNSLEFTVPVSALESPSTSHPLLVTTAMSSSSTQSQLSPTTTTPQQTSSKGKGKSTIWTHFTYIEATDKWTCNICLGHGITR